MNLAIDVDVTAALDSLDKLDKALRGNALQSALVEGAQVLDDWVKADMRSKPSPSLPGQTPAVDTEQLINSLTIEPLDNESVRYFTDVPYAPYLEFGTSRMAPRPFMRPAVEINTEKVIATIRASIEKAAGL